MSSTKTNKTGAIVSFILSALFIVTAWWVFTNRQHLLDQMTIWSYEPSGNVAAISDRVAFTDKGKFAFYATKPEVSDQASFNTQCPRQEVGSPILGCYTGEDRIYIYDITNEELDGMEEVTAAHEMLHAVWVRTSESDKKSLEKQLRAAYASIDDAELKERMDYYERTEPGEFINELHSILGTEEVNLSSELQAYYNKFFDRGKVLALHQNYDSHYKALYARANELYPLMESLSASIDTRSTSYDLAAKQLSADITAFNTRASNGSFTSMSQFNSQRASLVSRSNALEAERTGINNDIATYDKYYSEYEEISKQIEVLNDSIDSYNQIDAGPSV